MEWTSFMAALRFDQIALGGIVTWVIYGVLTGKLYSRKAVDEIRGERDDWKNAYFESDKANRILMSQNGELVDSAKTTDRIIRSLPELGARQ